MLDNPVHSAYHQQWLRRRVSTYWWLERRSYFAFILREVSSVFIAWFVMFLLLLLRAVAAGEQPYLQFLAWAAAPWVVLLNVVSLLFVIFHAITWFNLAPAAIVVHMHGRRVPGRVIAGSNYVAAIVASAVVAWLLLRG
jgi:fumarate reductase subunit C